MKTIIRLSLGVAAAFFLTTADSQTTGVAPVGEAYPASRVIVLSAKASFDQGSKESRYFSYWSGKLLCRCVLTQNNAESLDLSFPVGFGAAPSSLTMHWTTLSEKKMRRSGPVFISLVNSKVDPPEVVAWSQMNEANDPSLTISLAASTGHEKEYTNDEEVEGRIVAWLRDKKGTICLPLAQVRIPERSILFKYSSDRQGEPLVEFSIQSMRIIDFEDDTWELIIKNGNTHVNLPSDPEDAICRSFTARSKTKQTEDPKSPVDFQCAVLQAYRAGDIDAKSAKQAVNYFDSCGTPGSNLDQSQSVINKIRCSTLLNNLRESGQTMPQNTVPLLEINRKIFDQAFPSAGSSGRRIPPPSHTATGPEVTYYVRPSAVLSVAGSGKKQIGIESLPDGTIEHPYRTILQAYDAAKAIDSRRVELIVDGGYYDGQLDLDRNTILRAAPASRPVFGSTIVCTRALQLEIIGFSLIGAPSPGALQVLVPGSSISLLDVEIRDAHRYGIYQRGGEIELRSVRVQETRRERGQIEYGAGIVLQEGVRASMASVTSIDNESFGIIIRGRESYLAGTGVIVQRNKLHTDFYTDAVRRLDLPAGAFLIDDNAVANLTGFEIRENEFVGLGAYHNAEVTLENVIVNYSRSVSMEGDGEEGAPKNWGGIGILAKNGAHITMRNLQISDNSLLGVGVYTLGQIDLHVGDVCRNVIGAYCAGDVGAYDVSRLTDEVRYYDNECNYDASVLPVPGRDIPDMGD